MHIGYVGRGVFAIINDNNSEIFRNKNIDAVVNRFENMSQRRVTREDCDEAVVWWLTNENNYEWKLPYIGYYANGEDRKPIFVNAINRREAA